MTKLISCVSTLIGDLPRICLPYGLHLFDLYRWVGIARKGREASEFTCFEGDNIIDWQGSDVVELYTVIQRHCLNYKLASSYVVSRSVKSMFYFDVHERFTFFAADRDILSSMYPFPQEIVRENFFLLQEEDDDKKLGEIFKIIHTA